MSRESIRVARLATTTPGRFIDLEVSYMNARRKAYWAYARPVTVQESSGGFTGTSFVLFSDVSKLIVEVGRFNRKLLETIAGDWKNSAILAECLTGLLAKDPTLVLTPEAQAEAACILPYEATPALHKPQEVAA